MKVCFFCASSEALVPNFYNTAESFAKILVDNNWTLVTGGSNVGLMKKLIQTVKILNGKSIGVIPNLFVEKGLACQENSQIIITKNMQERKDEMINISDAFVILPGGFGTLDELFEILTLKQIGLCNKPIVIYNENNFYDNLLKQFDVIFENNFTKKQNKTIFEVLNTIEDTINYIKNYVNQDIDSKWFNVSKDSF